MERINVKNTSSKLVKVSSSKMSAPLEEATKTTPDWWKMGHCRDRVQDNWKVVANAKFRPDQIARNPWEDRLKYNRGDIQLSVT